MSLGSTAPPPLHGTSAANAQNGKSLLFSRAKIGTATSQGILRAGDPLCVPPLIDGSYKFTINQHRPLSKEKLQREPYWYPDLGRVTQTHSRSRHRGLITPACWTSPSLSSGPFAAADICLALLAGEETAPDPKHVAFHDSLAAAS